MRASTCVGRVGGLAVALGVGAAIATGGTGLALAAPTDDASSTGDTVRAATSRAHNAPTRRAPAAQKSGARNSKPPAANARRSEKPVPQAVWAERTIEDQFPTAAPAPATALSAPGSVLSGALISAAPAAPAPALQIAGPVAAMMAAPIAGAMESALRSLAYGPGSPAQSAANWTMLAAVRRLGRQQPSVDPTAGSMATSSAFASAAGGDPISGTLFNQTPTLSPAKIGQSATGVVTGSLNGVDADSSPLSYSVTAPPAHGSLSIDGSGNYTYTPDAELVHGGYTDSFQVTVSDADTGFHIHGLMGLVNLLTFGLIGDSGHTTTSTVSVTVAAVNKPPTASLTAGTPNLATGVVLGTVTASDPDADALTYSAAGVNKGVVVFGADGTFTYTPTAAARHNAAALTATAADKVDNFSVVVNDGHTGTVTLPVSVSIVPSNAVPTAVPSVGAPNVSTGVVFGALNPVDADGDSFTYAAAGATKGSVSVGANGSFTYTPTAAARHDAAALSASPEDKADSFTVTISDGHGGSIAVPIAVTILPANAAPVTGTSVGAPNVSTGVVTGAVTATDPDGDPLTFTGSTATGKGAAVVAADGSFSYTPTATARHNAASVTATQSDKTDTFTVTVTDGYGGSTAVPIVVAIAATNTAPATSSSVGSPNVSTGVVTGTVTATDAESDPLTFHAAGAVKGSVTVDTGGSFTYTPTDAARHQAASATATPADQADSFTITVNDGHGGSVAVPVSVSIVSANAAPATSSVVGAPNPSTGAVAGSVIAADADGDPLTYLASTPGKGAVVMAANGSFTYTPNAAARHIAASVTATDAEKTDSFTVTVNDGHGGSVVVPISVAVGPANTAPATSSTVGTPDANNGVVTGSVHGTDADGDAITYTGSVTTGKGTVVVGSDGSFTYTPTATARHNASSSSATAADESDTFSVTVADGHGGSVAVPITVSILPANVAPTVSSSTVGSPDVTTGVVAGAVLGADADSDPLTYAAAGSGKGTVAFSSGGSFTYTPTATARHNAASVSATDADKTDAFTVTVSDGHGGLVAVPITVAVGPENSAPTGSTTVGTPDATSGLVAGTVLGVDADTDPLTYTASGATKGSVTLNANGTFTYTPTTMARHNAFLVGATQADKTDTFTVTVSDGYGGSVAVPVTVTIAPAGVSFTFNYGSGSNFWSAPARTALNTAAANLASYIVVATPVTVTYDVIGQNNSGSSLLASASATFTGVGAGYYGTVIQTKILTGTDYNGATADSTITWNFGHSWDFDNNIGSRAYDFQAVALHELLHSFGFLTGVGDPANIDRNWSTYDKFLATSNRTKVIDATYTWISAYTGNLTGSGGGLYFAGPTAVAVYGGPVPLYTPGTWSSGSSVSHLDPTTPSAGTHVMNPSEGFGAGVRTISAVELAIMTDLGYTVTPTPVLAFVFVTIGLVRRRRP